MHISEGILTGKSMAATLAAGALAVGWGLTKMNELFKNKPERKPLLAMAGAFIFLISLTPFPAGPGTTTHPCGTPLAAILLGPGPTIVLAACGLLLQAAFFAHGGFSSLGANTLTLGLVGGLFGWLTYRFGRRAGLSIFVSAALAGLIGDVMTYVAAGALLSAHLAFFGQTPQHDFKGYLALIYGAYLPFQTPLAIGEALLTGFAIRSIARQRPEVLEDLGVEPKGFAKQAGALILLFALLAAPALRAAVTVTASASVSKVAELAAVPTAGFSGMDEVVNEAVAHAGGAPARDPYLNLENKGDLWNFVLLMGGGLAGFVVGLNWHRLFGPPKA
jgi:cobalt/nickel transport system permease protein